MPRWNRRRLGTRVMSRSKRVTEPPSGDSSPVMRLKSVVLPAPLGPMIRRRSPGSTARLTRAVTRRPPNAFSSSDTASALMVPSPSGAAGDLRGLAGEPHDVQSGVGPVGEIDEAALVGLDVVRL